MSYASENLPRTYRAGFESAIESLFDDPRVQAWSRCDSNCEDHLILACFPAISAATSPHLYCDAALDDVKFRQEWLQEPKRMQKILMAATVQFVRELRERFPAERCLSGG